jgi:hypothetical protein
MMHPPAVTEAAAFRKEVRHGAIFSLVLRNLPLRRVAADARGEIELMGCSKASGKRLCSSSWDIRAYQPSRALRLLSLIRTRQGLPVACELL